MDDPLARFKREQLAHTIANQEEKSSKEGLLEHYQAFSFIEKTDKTNRLQIRCAMGSTHSLAYNYLLDVCYDGFHGTELMLDYRFMQVKIKGTNLQSLITAIEKHECAYIQDYDARFFLPPKPNDAVIESIEVVLERA